MEIEGTNLVDPDRLLEQEGVLKKGAKDFSAEVSAEIPRIEELAKTSLDDALAALYVQEKRTRLGEDQPSTTRLVMLAAKLCVQSGDWGRLMSTMGQLAKRRQQFKLSTQRMLLVAIESLPAIADESERIKVITFLLDLTDGKIFLESERAQLTRLLVTIREARGELAEATRLIQLVQVESFSSMSVRDRLDFILEQMRLVLEVKEYSRMVILSRKIGAKALAAKENVDLKIRYHNLMIKYYRHEGDYYSAFLAHQVIYGEQATKDSKLAQLQAMVIFLVLSEHTPEQSDMLRRVYDDKNLFDLELFRTLLRKFFTMELISYSELCATHGTMLDNSLIGGESELSEVLKLRVAEHNVRVIAQYYRVIPLKRLSDLLGIDVDAVELRISKMVNTKAIWARIDRSQGIVNFRKEPSSLEIQDNWTRNVNDIFKLIEKTCHLIDRENVLHE